VKTRTSHWLDSKSGRDVWVFNARTVDDWPAEPPWSCPGFGLLFVAEHVMDVEQLAELALAQGLAIACAWGPGCSMIEDGFDEVIVDHGPEETSSDAVLTNSHSDESLGEAFDFFLEAARPSRARVAGCAAWAVFALGESNQRRIVRALRARGATVLPVDVSKSITVE
jgi:hypothetical protein